MDWQSIKTVNLPSSVMSWVADTGSLTARCQNLFAEHYNLRLLDEHWGNPNQIEQYELNLGPTDKVKIREIFLCNDETPIVFGHSILPQAIFDDEDLNLEELGAGSLGHKLFAHPDCQRGPIFVKEINATDELFIAASKHTVITAASLWARYSVFTINHLQLIVYEVFFDHP